MVCQKNKGVPKDNVFELKHLHPGVVSGAEYDDVDLHQESAEA